MGDGQPTRSSRQSDPAELPASVDWTELNDELSTIEQHCQLFDDMLNASKPGKTSHSDREVLKVTICSSQIATITQSLIRWRGLRRSTITTLEISQVIQFTHVYRSA